MYCTACSQTMPPGAKFCGSCGTAAAAADAGPVVSPATATPARAIPSDTANHAKIIYFMNLAGVLTFGVTSLVGLVWAYVSRNEGTDLTRSHFDYQIATFTKSVILGFALLVIAGIMFGISFAAGFVSFALGSLLASLVSFAWGVGGLGLVIWNIARSVKGLLILGRNAPIRNARVWGLPV